MINIIFNYIIGLPLESKSEYVVENNIHHLVIFQKCICFCLYYLQSRFMPELSFSNLCIYIYIYILLLPKWLFYCKLLEVLEQRLESI